MNNDFEKTLLLNLELIKKIDVSLPQITDSLGKTKFVYTSKSLLSFIPRGGYLVSSILSSCEKGDVYSSSILFRSLIEHVFRHLYVFTRALNEDSDTVGKEYLDSLKASEDLEAIEKIINYKKVVYPEETKWDTGGDHNNNIREIRKQFRIERIFYYLIQNNSDKDEILKKAKKEYLLQRLIEYTNMSSSVHGGSFGNFALAEIRKDQTKLENTLRKFINDSYVLYKSLIEATYLFAYLRDESMRIHYEDIMRDQPDNQPVPPAGAGN